MTNGEHSVFITGQLGGCDNEIRNLRQALTTVLAQTLHTWPAAGWATPLEFKDNLLRGLSSPGKKDSNSSSIIIRRQRQLISMLPSFSHANRRCAAAVGEKCQ